MLQLANLDDRTRRYMILEFEYDSSHNQVYISPRLSPRGRADWPGLLRESFLSGNHAALASQLRLAGRLETREARQTKRGRVIGVNVPETAAETLAEGEFNRFYIRALCRRAVDYQISSLVIYRAKSVASPRPASELRIGKSIDPQKLLSDLRANIGVDPALGVPAGPNSGLSVRLL